MERGRTGVWLVGAWGGVATTVVVGLAALRRGLTTTTGLVSELPPFADIDLLNWDELVIGGHEIRRGSYLESARQLHQTSRVFSTALLEAVAEDLAAADRRIRPGTVLNVGSTIETWADREFVVEQAARPAEVVSRLAEDIRQFQRQEELARVVVVYVSSTEPPVDEALRALNWQRFEPLLDDADERRIPASSLYALAAFEAQAAFINFTPSCGSDLPALEERARELGVAHVGRDGKTGETLLKSVLAPMFAARHLHVSSWVGHNILGNMDGKALDDPTNKANKVRSKDHLLTEILGYRPQTHVSIEYIESLGDWKTAWDHIHFEGFLNTPMVLQFTWQGCDSLLAAPLVLDLVRLTEREVRRGGAGVMPHLASFFKSPMGVHPADFGTQFAALLAWADSFGDQ